MKKILVVAIACILLFSSMLVVGGSSTNDEQITKTGIGKIKLFDVLLDKLSNMQLPAVLQNLLERILNFFGYDGGREGTLNGGQITLYADQDIDIGYVEVTNDADNIYVKYVITDLDWCITKTIVHVCKDPDFFPVNKKGNPQVGLFDYQTIHNCVTTFTYTIPLDESWENGDEILIAAHANVIKPIEGCYETLWQIGDVEGPSEMGWLTNYADEFNWEYPAGPITAGPSLAVSQPAFTNPFIVGSTPTDEFPYNSNYNRGYATDFDVQYDGWLPFGGRMTISWSPGQSAQEKKVISDGFASQTLTATGTPRPGEGWFLDTYPLVEHSFVFNDCIPSGTHTINFKHTKGDGTFWDWIKLEKTCVQDETAWADGTRFVDKGNWATYFTYILDIPLECPGIISHSSNIDLISYIPSDVRVGSFESTQVRVWKEFEGELPVNLYCDLDEGRNAKIDGPPTSDIFVPAGTPVCIFYVHFDGFGGTAASHSGLSITFGADILGVIISGGNIGTFANRDLMFTADTQIGYSGTIYPDPTPYPPNVDHLRGYDVNHPGNIDDAEFIGATLYFDTYVSNAHDSLRVIVPMV